MYGDDGAMSDGTEHLSEETSDKAEHPLTVLLNSYSYYCSRVVLNPNLASQKALTKGSDITIT